MERVSEQLAESWDRTSSKIAELVKDLVQTHRDEILECWADSGESKYPISVNVQLKGAANAPLVTTKISWARKYSDEASEQVDDPNQPDLFRGANGENDSNVVEADFEVEEPKQLNAPTPALTNGGTEE